MARTRDLISSLINITASWDVPFHQLQQLQGLHYGATFEPLCAPNISDDLRLVPNGFSMRHKYHWDASNSYNVMKWVQHHWNQGIMVFTHCDKGRTLHKWIFHIFHNGWMDCRCAFHVVLCLYCCVTDRTYVAAHEAYWLMGFPKIKHWGVR